jgi:hypothetical protein
MAVISFVDLVMSALGRFFFDIPVRSFDGVEAEHEQVIDEVETDERMFSHRSGGGHC